MNKSFKHIVGDLGLLVFLIGLLLTPIAGIGLVKPEGTNVLSRMDVRVEPEVEEDEVVEATNAPYIPFHTPTSVRY